MQAIRGVPYHRRVLPRDGVCGWQGTLRFHPGDLRRSLLRRRRHRRLHLPAALRGPRVLPRPPRGPPRPQAGERDDPKLARGQSEEQGRDQADRFRLGGAVQAHGSTVPQGGRGHLCVHGAGGAKWHRRHPRLGPLERRRGLAHAVARRPASRGGQNGFGASGSIPGGLSDSLRPCQGNIGRAASNRCQKQAHSRTGLAVPMVCGKIWPQGGAQRAREELDGVVFELPQGLDPSARDAHGPGHAAGDRENRGLARAVLRLRQRPQRSN
mmetsp:Transcript_174562/g.559648  ORF Transcript_174562/g.559648 Transcript_174562/m.559648 type:complete len:268 (+) Transcript_174562:891-1694(+)